MFMGKTFEVEDWAKFITEDEDGYYAWEIRPHISSTGLYFIHGDTVGESEKVFPDPISIMEIE